MRRAIDVPSDKSGEPLVESICEINVLGLCRLELNKNEVFSAVGRKGRK